MLKTKLTFDRIDYTTSKRTMTDEGYMIVRDCRVARTGVQDYLASELGMDTSDGDYIVGVMRPAEEVFAADSLASFEGKPVTVDHPSEFVTADNWQQYAAGHMSNVRRMGNDMVADLMITRKDAVKAVNDGKAQLSNGYSHSIDWQAGDASGKPFVCIQRDIRGNHVACVDQARAGPDYRVSDHKEKELVMSTTDSAPKTVNVVVDGAVVEANAAAALVIDRLTKERDAAKADLTKAQDAATNAAKTIADLTTENETLKANQLTDSALADITLSIDQSKKIAPELAISGSNPAEIRRAAITAAYDKRKSVIDAALCGVELAKAEPAALKMIAGVLAADSSTKTEDTKPEDRGFTMAVKTDSKANDGFANDGFVSAQAAFLQRFTGQGGNA